MIESESGDLQTCVHVAVLPNNVVLSQLCDAQSESQGEQDENESGDLDQHGHLLSDLLNPITNSWTATSTIEIGGCSARSTFLAVFSSNNAFF